MITDKNAFDGSLHTKGAFFKRAGYDGVQDQISTSAARYVDPATGEVDASKTVQRDCLVCTSTQRRRIFTKNGFTHVQCRDCGFLYVNPILRDDILVEYYSGIEGSWADITEKEEYNAFQNKYYHFQLDNIERHVATSNRAILDVGCNNGEFLMVARARGWTPIGQEINRYAVSRARQKGIEVLDDEFSVGLFGERKFGAVTLLGVLEHLPYPEHFLRIIGAILEPGGILATHVPNADALATRVLREKCNTFDGIEHVNFWNRATFARFVAKNGFQLVHAETAISEIYTLNNHLHYDHPYAPMDEHPLLLDTVTPEYVHQHFLGHLLCSYARPV